MTDSVLELPTLEITDRTFAGKRLMSKSFRPNLKGLVSIGDPDAKVPAGFRNSPNTLRLIFDDVTLRDNPKGYVFPGDDDIKRLISFANGVRSVKGTIVVHCFAGLCRSPAAGFIMNCVWMGPEKEDEAMQRTLDACREDFPSPNSLMVEIADKLLERGGAMINCEVGFANGARGMY